ncbi:hypothetical protein AK830_g4115 [Neonectria ditissima]|uniref:Uncharacterized protein n=1 Tax=Neonectria ditissima TaxID=78410 RepID=A0A0P7BPK5_9HYPO|nr:hypothetical protein AK830_g4115 [Neonectria ditissima]
MARTAGWRANWAILAAFTTRVDKEMVLVAQAIMTILFGSCSRNSYVACRPKYLKPSPRDWGLNEIGPLRLDGVATYYKDFDAMDPEEAAILRQKRAISGKTRSLTASRRREDRLRNGGPVRVYVVQQGGRVVRFQITLMTAKDGAHVDITIPLLIGLDYGLQISRTVDIRLELSARNHHAPFAIKAAYNTEARRLGMILSGTRAAGPQKGVKFTHWLQSTRKGTLDKAAKLIQFLRNRYNRCGEAVREETTSKFVVWSGQSFLNTSEPVSEIHQPFPERQAPQVVEVQSIFQRAGDQRFYEILLQMTKALQRLSISRKIRATPSVRSYFKTHTAKAIATTIATAVRPQVTDVLLSTAEFTVSKLLSLGGNIRDESQGVYADIVTNEHPGYFRIYIGAASSAGSQRFAGLRRRIQEHLGFAKSKSGRAQSGIPHCTEMTKPGAHPNFVVLIRFSEVVPIPIVHVAEALMTILFASWDNQTFMDLRPGHLAEHRDWGLNKANPLDFGIVSIYDRDRVKAQLVESARKKAARNKTKSIENARAGHFVRTYPDRMRNNFRFKLCAESIMISATLGGDLGLKGHPAVKVECDIRVQQHPSPYALKASWKSNARRLGICLKGEYSQGPCKGQGFKKWVQCGSHAAVARAERIVGRLEGWYVE